jgi:hypothetical protein
MCCFHWLLRCLSIRIRSVCFCCCQRKWNVKNRNKSKWIKKSFRQPSFWGPSSLHPAIFLARAFTQFLCVDCWWSNGEKYTNIVCYFFFFRASHAEKHTNRTIKFYGVVFIIKFISGSFLSIFLPLSENGPREKKSFSFSLLLGVKKISLWISVCGL